MSRARKSHGNQNTGPEADGPRSGRRIGSRRFAALAAVALVAVALAITLVYARWGGDGEGPSGPKTAAIVDQLSLTAPNPEFAAAATETLEEAGYGVDYFPGEEVTVDFYRGLAAGNYDFIILRAHSARLQQEWQGELIDEVILFTTEPYDEKKYVEEQLSGNLATARYFDDSEPLFGIGPDFIRSSMPGSFSDTTIVLMGCEGLGSEDTAQAFVAKGAKTVISWSGLVSATHTDAATEDLLGLLLDEGLPPEEAVVATMDEVGPDPTYGSELLLLQ